MDHMMMMLWYSRVLRFGRLALYLWAIWMLATADVSAGQRPGCPSKCGDVDIPFPFGIGDQCAFHHGFNIICKPVDGTNRPFIGVLEVTKISVRDAKAWVKMDIVWQCYNQSTRQMDESLSRLNFTYTPFRLSKEDNKIFVIGCNTMGYVKSESYIIGCLSTCTNERKNGSCYGVGAGCCEVDVPDELAYLDPSFDRNYDTSLIPETPCGYVVVMEKAAFNYITTYMASSMFRYDYNGTVPAVMDWVIERETCEEAKKNISSYACVSVNSNCVDSTNGEGYRCSCSDGYDGNPYIKDGCKDINECLDNATYPCAGICQNTLGNFICSCPDGQRMVSDICIRTAATKATTGLLVGIGVGSGMGIFSLVFGIILVKQNLKKLRVKAQRAKYFEQNRGFLLQQLVDKDIAEKMIFSLEELEKATNIFDDARMLGGGGHGTVYKGILSNQHVVAIKKSNKAIEREISDFINEVAILSQINHRNIVRLFGCCLETEVPLLVYEFIPNGTLSDHLYVEGHQSLAWKDRLRIATETASALSYLHLSASTAIIHRDIKSDNIMLDDRLTAKVSDFGASRGVPIDQIGVTTAVQGTFGYLDPEYYQTGRLTDKSDVYSFGVILVELLTRKRPISFMSEERVSLIAHFNLLVSQDKLPEILDPQVILEGAKDAEVVAALAVTCLRLHGEMRPTMRQVEMTLQRLLGAGNNTIQERADELNHDISTEMSIGEYSTSSKQCSIEQEALLSASFPR